MNKIIAKVERDKVKRFLEKVCVFDNYYVMRNIISAQAFKNVLERQILDADARFYFPNDSPFAIITIRNLAWDSEVLERRVAELNFFKSRDFTVCYDNFDKFWKSVENFLISSKIEYLKIRFNAKNVDMTIFLEEKSFRLVDSIIRFNKNIVNFKFDNFYNKFKHLCNLKVKEGCEDVEKLTKLGRKLFRYDRFHNDPIISNEIADKVYSLWIRNSCKGKISDKVFTVFNEKELLGFVTCKVNDLFDYKIGYIDLIGVSEKARGTTASDLLLLHALSWFKSMGIEYVEIETQIMNIGAIRFYEKWGFKAIQTYFTMRRAMSYEKQE